ncbi:MAG: helix-turn-helix transcriptional regulator [Eubacteriales bacterium]|nr:helix-turn-helix transcriptional regulator [Eubacteriales bacterium]
MNEFKDLLNKFMKEAGISGKELATKAGLSEALISRYKSGQRIPSADSENLRLIADAIETTAEEKSITLSRSDIYEAFITVIPSDENESLDVVKNFNALITVLDLKISDLARSLNFDPSYIYKIQSGSRRPADARKFVSQVSSYVVRNAGDTGRQVIAKLSETDPDVTDRELINSLEKWMLGNYEEPENNVSDFLSKLDEFDLNEYIESIHFNEMKVPSVPMVLPHTKTYYGLEEMKKGEIDFMKSAVLSKSMEDVFMCADTPMEDMAEDKEFGKKWMMGLAFMLRKGLRLNLIHNINRPFNELMLGLESWIPMYMTGQVSPYCLKGLDNTYYHHLLYVSGTEALSGECLAKHHENGKYYLTNNKEEYKYYKRRADDLLSMARPIMRIYREDEEKIVNAFLESESEKDDAEIRRFDSRGFKNISMEGKSGKWILITKTNDPKIWFLIHHTDLVTAIENYIPPYVES